MDIASLMGKLQELLVVHGIKIIIALVIFIVGRWIVKAVRNFIKSMMTKKNVDPAVNSFVCSLIYVTLLIFVIIAALAQVGIQTTSLIAVLGAASLAIGLALQGSLANFAAGVLLIIFRPFKVGDYVECAGTAGAVYEMQIFTTQLKSPDNKKIIIPNAKLLGDVITNYSAQETRRVDLVIGVSYSDDLQKVEKVLTDILSQDERVLKDPAPTIAVLELADSSVNFAVRPWVKTGDYWNVYFALTKNIKMRLDAEGIAIPFPQRDVHLYQQKEGATQ
jgi:small conductance mechanosensitive channel